MQLTGHFDTRWGGGISRLGSQEAGSRLRTWLGVTPHIGLLCLTLASWFVPRPLCALCMLLFLSLGYLQGLARGRDDDAGGHFHLHRVHQGRRLPAPHRRLPAARGRVASAHRSLLRRAAAPNAKEGPHMYTKRRVVRKCLCSAASGVLCVPLLSNLRLPPPRVSSVQRRRSLPFPTPTVPAARCPPCRFRPSASPASTEKCPRRRPRPLTPPQQPLRLPTLPRRRPRRGGPRCRLNNSRLRRPRTQRKPARKPRHRPMALRTTLLSRRRTCASWTSAWGLSQRPGSTPSRCECRGHVGVTWGSQREGPDMRGGARRGVPRDCIVGPTCGAVTARLLSLLATVVLALRGTLSACVSSLIRTSCGARKSTAGRQAFARSARACARSTRRRRSWRGARCSSWRTSRPARWPASTPTAWSSARLAR